MIRRVLLMGSMAAVLYAQPGPALRLVDVTKSAGITFDHNAGAFGAKYLPETMGPGCAFPDYNSDGWLDVLLVNGTKWPGEKGLRTTPKLYRNNGNGTFTDVTDAAGLAVEVYGMGVAAADFDNDGHTDLLITCVGQNRLFHNNGRGQFVDVTTKAGLGGRSGFSTSALWFDYDRDGLLDLFVCNYVKWSPEHDVFCSIDGKRKSYCTPEAYRGATSWLFRNRGNGTFADVTADAGIFDASSKALGVAMLDHDRDGWPDLVVANDTQPNKLYRNLKNGTFEEIGLKTGIAFSEHGKARAGMGIDVADYENSGIAGIAITNFENEMIGLYRAAKNGTYSDVAIKAGVGQASRNSLGFGCAFLDIDLDGMLDLIAVNGHIDDTVRPISGNVGQAQSPQLFFNEGGGNFRDAANAAGDDFAAAKVGRGLAYGDFDRDGDLDLLMTTNQASAYLFRNDVANGNRSLRLRLVGTKSNRDAIGTVVRVYTRNEMQMRMVRSGSSYLSQSELALSFGLGRGDAAERVVVEWPTGRTQEFRSVAAGVYECVEGTGLRRVAQ